MPILILHHDYREFPIILPGSFSTMRRLNPGANQRFCGSTLPEGG